MIDYQKTTKEMMQKYGSSSDIMARYADVVSELGEFGKELLLGNNYGTAPFKQTDNLALEMGDVIAALALLANVLDLNLDECFEAAMEKYRKRFEERGWIGS